jgi:23S rRNA pseudouridine2605 synthase
MTDEQRPPDLEPASFEDQLIEASREKPGDPIGDETDGEAHLAAEDPAPDAEPEESDEPDAVAEAEAEETQAGEPEAEAEETEAGEAEDEDEPEARPRPPAKLERLQKILAQSGVASRRKAEEMIEQGRVQVNGKVVTELGTKADAGRDHIRVDGKLLHGAERLRYFVLNKPRGFVTTVKDPEGRPTVMQFFDKLRERLYPVGRLDYQSEGLLLVTNDGELANRLTRAASGVEKTYLVKVAGIPSESELDILRAGVAIEKGKPGSAKVRTSPARIRQVRQGDNPWYEVVLIEGRNRELRKMFEEVGHFVEKIRRVGYGPLILDQEPGNFRELDDNELTLLRKAADGTLKTPKAKDIRRRNIIDSLPPEKAASKPRGERPAAGPKDYQPKKAFGIKKPFGARKTFGDKKTFGAAKPFDAGRKFEARKPFDSDRPAGVRPSGDRPEPARPPRSSDARPPRPFGTKPPAAREASPRPPFRKPEGQGKPGFRPERAGFQDKAGFRDRPGFKKPSFPRPEATRRPPPEPIDDDLEPRKPTRLHIEPVQDTERSPRSGSGRPSAGRPASNRPGSARPTSARPSTERPAPSSGYGSSRPPAAGRSGPPRAAASGRPPAARPFRSEGGPSRAAFTSNGKPRAGGPRPSSKPGRAAGRPFSAGPAGGDTGSGRNAGGGWKPRPSFGGKKSSGPPSSGPRTSSGSAGSGDRPRPRPGGFSKSGSSGSGSARPGSARPGSARPSFSKPAFKKSAHKPGAKPGGPRPGGKRRG